MSPQDFSIPDFLPINPYKTINIENITVSCNIEIKRPLKIITEETDFQIEDSKSRSLGMAKQNLSDGASLRLHSSGEIVCVGFCNPERACLAITECVDMLAQHGLCNNTTPTRVIENIFASAVMGKQIYLERLDILTSDRYEYEPSQINSAIYKYSGFDESKYHKNRSIPEVTTKIFSSGRIQIFGATHREMIYAVISDILLKLEKECVH
jgi:TATA-box binding protein (TBP) (component of TFIID and TFIIIB)